METIVEIVLKGNEQIDLDDISLLVKIDKENLQDFKRELLKEMKNTTDNFNAYDAIVEIVNAYKGKIITPDEQICINDWGNADWGGK